VAVVTKEVEAEIGELEVEDQKNCARIARERCNTYLTIVLSWRKMQVSVLQLGVLACDGGEGADNALVNNTSSTKLVSNSTSTAYIYSPPVPIPEPIPSPKPHNTPNPSLTPNQTAIVDTGATGIYFAHVTPVCAVNPQAPTIAVGTATGHVQHSTTTAELALP